jgi:hypothetical protein
MRTATLIMALVLSLCGFAFAEDLTPPMPNPTQWAISPYGLEDSSHIDYPITVYYHSMAAVTATDESGPVQYYFDCISGNSTDSGWIDFPTYTTGPFLTLNYSGYRVCARDTMGNVNSFSVIAYTTVPEPVTICLFGIAGLILRRKK